MSEAPLRNLRTHQAEKFKCIDVNLTLHEVRKIFPYINGWVINSENKGPSTICTVTASPYDAQNGLTTSP